MIATPKKKRLSYCTTCKGRLDHLKDTLPANLALEAADDEVEFVILDYDCPEGTIAWLKSNFEAEIKSGKLRIARHAPAPIFDMQHSKNMAVRLATGEVVCNLDADNFITPNTSRWLIEAFRENTEIFVTTRPLTILRNLHKKTLGRSRNVPRPPRDLRGLIAISRQNFERLGGYDEKLVGGWSDVNFGVGARRLGLKIVLWPAQYWTRVIQHSDSLRMRFITESYRRIWEKRMRQSRLVHVLTGMRVLQGRRPVRANLDGAVGCGEVYLNFSDTPMQLAPLPAWGDSAKKRRAG